MSGGPLTIGGWEIHAHPLFLDRLEDLIAAVETAKEKNPQGYAKLRAAKLLAAVLKVSFEMIPQDPTRPEYRQGDTLGAGHRHWFRVKFLQQYRLFFRYREAPERRIIVFAWVNDDSTLRAYDSRSDAYAVFRKMLGQGHPPDDWDGLLKAAGGPGAQARLRRARAASRRKPED